MPDPISVIIPARDEDGTIAQVVATMRGLRDVAEVVVIDNGSSDDTAQQADAAGARVIHEPRPGMGHAVRSGVAAARNAWVMKVDADLGRFDTRLFARMAEARAPGVGLVKGAWNDPADPMPMTRLLVAPALRQMFPGLCGLRAPNSGIYLFDRSRIAHERLTGDYAVDLDVMLRIHAAGAEVAEVDIGRIVHDSRDLGHYSRMAEQILAFLLSLQPLGLLQEVVVMAEDDAQALRNAAGLMAGKLIAGARVTACLGEAGQHLDTLAGFPTFRSVPLGQAAGLAPHANAASLCIVAPATGSARAEAEALAARVTRPAELWEMPGGAGWVPDVAVDPGEGSALRRAALGRLAPGQGAPRRELFRRAALRRP